MVRRYKTQFTGALPYRIYITADEKVRKYKVRKSIKKIYNEILFYILNAYMVENFKEINSNICTHACSCIQSIFIKT